MFCLLLKSLLLFLLAVHSTLKINRLLSLNQSLRTLAVLHIQFSWYENKSGSRCHIKAAVFNCYLENLADLPEETCIVRILMLYLVCLDKVWILRESVPLHRGELRKLTSSEVSEVRNSGASFFIWSASCPHLCSPFLFCIVLML